MGDRKSYLHCFFIELAFEQVLLGSNPNTVPRQKQDKPTGVWGKFNIAFESDFSKAYFKLYVYGSDVKCNKNTWVTSAYLQAGRSYENGDIIALIYKRSDGHGYGKKVNGKLEKGELQNLDISQVSAPSGARFNTIASLLDGILRGEVYVIVNGSDQNSDEPDYSVGMLRGQFLNIKA